MIDLSPVWLSLQLALLSTLLLLLIGIPLAYGLSVWRWKGKPLVEALVTMPLVLPPTVLGFYLLMAFSPQSSLGHFLSDTLGLNLLFTFQGLVLASVIYSLPFMVNPIYAALSNLPTSLKEAAQVLGFSPWRTLRTVLLPNIKPAILTAVVLSFAHIIGEFGVVLMIGGNIPDETRVASIAIYDQVEALHYAQAHVYALVLFAITFVILAGVYFLNRNQKNLPL